MNELLIKSLREDLKELKKQPSANSEAILRIENKILKLQEIELKLYVEDFRALTDWFAICRQLKIDITSTVITIKVSNAEGEQE